MMTLCTWLLPPVHCHNAKTTMGQGMFCPAEAEDVSCERCQLAMAPNRGCVAHLEHGTINLYYCLREKTVEQTGTVKANIGGLEYEIGNRQTSNKVLEYVRRKERQDGYLCTDCALNEMLFDMELEKGTHGYQRYWSKTGSKEINYIMIRENIVYEKKRFDIELDWKTKVYSRYFKSKHAHTYLSCNENGSISMQPTSNHDSWKEWEVRFCGDHGHVSIRSRAHQNYLCIENGMVVSSPNPKEEWIFKVHGSFLLLQSSLCFDPPSFLCVDNDGNACIKHESENSEYWCDEYSLPHVEPHAIRSKRTSDPVSICYDIAGSGPLVVFLHGIGGNRSNWTRQLDSFANLSFCTVSWDARGYGESDDSPQTLKFSDYADDLLRLLNDLKADKAHLVGLSMGGMILQDFYARHSDRVATLSLVDTSCGLGCVSDEIKQEFLSRRLDPLEKGLTPKDIAPSVVDAIVSEGASVPVRQQMEASISALRVEPYKQALHAIVTTDFRSVLPTIRVPTLVLVGDKDKVTPPEASEFLASSIHGATLVMIPDAGHLTNIEMPDAFDASLGAFLEKHAEMASVISATSP